MCYFTSDIQSTHGSCYGGDVRAQFRVNLRYGEQVCEMTRKLLCVFAKQSQNMFAVYSIKTCFSCENAKILL